MSARMSSGSKGLSDRRAAVAAWALCALTLTTAALAGVLLVGVGDTNWAVLLPEAKPPSEGVALTCSASAG
jgi:hypothetical protein